MSMMTSRSLMNASRIWRGLVTETTPSRPLYTFYILGFKWSSNNKLLVRSMLVGTIMGLLATPYLVAIAYGAYRRKTGAENMTD